MATRRPGDRSALGPVLVVGGGVSGCAAAAALADAGLRVVLLTSALDTLGLPGYGPVLVASPAPAAPFASVGGVVGALQCLPAWYRPVWLDGLRCVEGRPDLALIDRRLVALHTKWMLENHPLVNVRQGLVVAVRCREAGEGGGAAGRGAGGGESAWAESPGVEVESVFGEVFAGSACVLAVGLALGGRVRMGEQEAPGGRLGEVAADALRDDLAAQGVSLEPAEVSVGARLRWPGPAADLAAALGGDPRDLVTCSDATLDSPLVALRPDGLPPLPEVGRDAPGCVLFGAGAGEGGLEGEPPPGIWPDGAATGEWYASVSLPSGASRGRGEAAGGASAPGPTVVRPAHLVRGSVLPCVGGFGAVPVLPGGYITGQAAGARGYLGSLEAGIRVAEDVVEALTGGAAAQ